MSKKTDLKQMKRIASLLLRAKNYRVNPINDDEAKNLTKMYDHERRKGFIEGLAVALAISVQEYKDESFN